MKSITEESNSVVIVPSDLQRMACIKICSKIWTHLAVMVLKNITKKPSLLRTKVRFQIYHKYSVE